MGRGRQGTTDRRNIRKLQIVLKLVMHIFITYLSIYILISITNDMSFRKERKNKKNATTTAMVMKCEAHVGVSHFIT